jgi:hypothetical protein
MFKIVQSAQYAVLTPIGQQYFKSKDADVYFGSAYVGEDFSLEDAEAIFELSDAPPAVNLAIKEQRALIEALGVVEISVPDEDPTDDTPAWTAGEFIRSGEVRSFEGQNYRCRQPHVTQSDWSPPATPALWEFISAVNTKTGYVDWIQPTGAHDAYALGAKVAHKGTAWISTIPANVYEPPTFWDPYTA